MRIKNLKIRPTVSVLFLIVVTFFFQPSPVGGTSVVWTDRTVYDQSETIHVMFSNAPGKDSDWICIVPAGSPDTDGGDYQYMPRGISRGSLVFAPRSPGEYEARAYYNYRRNGYVVTGRYAFSVVGDPDWEPSDQGVESTYPEYSSQSDLPPSIVFVDPPNVVVLPGTDVYAVPDVEVEIFFQGGWWWRPWSGRWYRSRYYDHGWSYYRDPPSWYKRIPRDWRYGYRNHVWSGRPWNPPRINHGNLNNHWRGSQWRNDHGLGSPGKTAPPAGRPAVVKPHVTPGKPAPPIGGPGKHVPPVVGPVGGKPVGSPGKPIPPAVGPSGGRPGAGPGKPAQPTVGPGSGKPGGGPGKQALPTVGPGGVQPGNAPGGVQPGGGPGGGKPGGGSGKPPLRGFGYDNRPESGGR